jgi:hypothetical protein
MTEGLQKLDGQVVTIDHTARKVAVRNKDGVITALTWSAGLDAKMAKLKEHFFQSFYYMGERIDDCHYLAKPTDWPQQQKSGENWQGKPRNDIQMIVLGLHKNYTALMVAQTSNGDFDNECDTVMARVEEDAPKLVALIKKMNGGA